MWSIRPSARPDVTVSPFPGCCRRFFLTFRQMAASSLPSPSSVLSSLIPQDLASTSEMFFLPWPQLAFGLHFGLPERLSAVNTTAAVRIGWIQPAGRASERFRPHFPFSTRLPGDRKRGSLPITHCPLQLKLPDRARECRLPAGSIRRFFGGRC
ncbi:unnamed protein product [Lasius platythorax]|uniref:Uncharacterized protein n=1 Tax=Lasius platythorax TaxID=488582 RepID=A0AAV2N3K6_9HYME